MLGIVVAAVVEVVILVSVQAANYLAFTSSQGDLGNYNQAFFTTVHGQGLFYYTTNIPAGSGGSLFAVHFSPFLLLLVPFYALSPSPIALIALKQIGLALGALPLYGIARVYFERRTIPVFFAALYLISPLTIAVDWNSFDPEAFIPLTTLVALYFLVRGRFWWFLTAWILTLSIIESIPALLALFAAGGLIGTFLWPPSSPWLTRAKERRYLFAGLVTALVWLGLAYLALRAISPIQGAFGQVYAARYVVLGANSFLDVLPQAVTHPALAGAALHYQGSLKLLFVEVMILASGAVSVLGGLRYLLPFAGYLVLALLSNSVPLYIFGAQYPAYVSALLFVGGIEGTVFLLDLFLRTSYDTRRAGLMRHLRQEVRRLGESARETQGQPGWREEGVRRLRSAVIQIEAGDLPRAAHEVRWARRFQTVEGRGSAGVRPIAVGQTEATGLRSKLASRMQAWRKSRSIGGTASFEFAVSLIPILCILVASGLANPLLSAPVAGGDMIAYGQVPYTTYDSTLHSVIQLIPSDGAVLTTGHIFPEVSNRRDAYTLVNSGFILGTANYSVQLNRWLNQSNYVLTDYKVDPQNSVIIRGLGNLSGFGLYASEDEAYLYERGWNSPPAYFVPWTESIAGGSFVPTPGNSVSYKAESSLGPSLYHPAGGTPSEKLWSGPNAVNVPPGKYQVTFSFEISTSSNSSSLRLRVDGRLANITDTVKATSDIGSHHTISVAPDNETAASGPPLALVEYASYDPGLTFASETMDFTWNQNGYLNFPGFELSTRMSMYFLGVTLVQLSPLP